MSRCLVDESMMGSCEANAKFEVSEGVSALSLIVR